MASPATAAFLTAWRKPSRVQPALLVKVLLSGRTLYLADRLVTTPDGRWWEPLILRADPIEAPGSFLSSGFDQCSGGFTIADRQMAWQAAGKTAAHAFQDFEWQSQKVVMYLWEMTLTSFADAFPVFNNAIVTGYRMRFGEIEVQLLQRRDWNRTVTPNTVTRTAYPRAPEKSIGAPIPIVFGDGGPIPMRGDWDGATGSSKHVQNHIGGDISAVPGALVDTGVGGSGGAVKAKVLFASHKVKTVNDWGAAQNGIDAYLKLAGGLPALYQPATADLVNDTGEAGFLIPDGSVSAWVGVLGNDITAGLANPADNPRATLDPMNEYRYALLDYDALKRDMKILLPDLAPLGLIQDIQFFVAVETGASVAGTEVICYNDSRAAGTFLVLPTSSRTAGGASLAAGAWPLEPWKFSDLHIRIRFSGVGTGVTFKVYWAGLVIQFVPNFTEVRGTRKWQPEESYYHGGDRFDVQGRRRGRDPAAVIEQIIYYPISTLDGDWFANLLGREDSGSPVNVDAAGTYTGTANALIERPCDIAWCLLRNYAGQAAAQVETGASIHGSFVDARALLKTWRQTDMRYFVMLDAAASVHDLLTDLARQSLSWFYLSRFDDKFKWVPWRANPPQSYDRTLKPDDLLGPELLDAEITSEALHQIGASISYLWDPFRKTLLAETAVYRDSSRAGHDYLDLRDETCNVTAGVNDKMDVKPAGQAAMTATLAGALYTPIGLAQEVAAKLTALFSGINYIVGWGPTIVAGYNDKLDFNDGVSRTVTLAASAYATMEVLATEVASKMNSVSSNWSCSFTRSTLKFTISRSSGTATLQPKTGSNRTTAAWTTLGFNTDTDKSGASSYVGSYEREEERMCPGCVENLIGQPFTFEILWETGASGLTGTKTDCHEPLGFDGLRDRKGGNTSHLGDAPKNARERTLTALSDPTAALGSSSRRQSPIQARMIRETATARELRNRIVDLASQPVPLVSFRSLMVPDLERGKALRFDAGFDAVVPYPRSSITTWAGRSFWALSTRQHLGPDSWDTEVVAIEAL